MIEVPQNQVMLSAVAPDLLSKCQSSERSSNADVEDSSKDGDGDNLHQDS